MSTANGALGGPAPAAGGLPNSGAPGPHAPTDSTVCSVLESIETVQTSETLAIRRTVH